jgi:membrane protein required for colicin V production
MGNLPITAVDVVVAVVLLGSAMFAFLRGFVHEVLAIAAWVGAGFATLYGLPYAQPFFRQHIGMAWAADIAAGLVLFLVALLVLSILTKAVSDRVRRSALNSVDSSLGFVFGLARGAVLLTLAYMVVAWMLGKPEEQPAWLADAKSRPWLERGAGLLRSLAPEGFGAAEDKTHKASEDAQRAIEAHKAFRNLTSPQPAAPASGGDKDKTPAYDNAARREMDRLFQSNQ